MKRRSLLRGLLFAFLLISACAAGKAQSTALDRYVAAPDPSYGFRLVRTTPVGGVTAHVLELTSQTWMTAAEVDRPLWRHWLVVYVPTVRAGTTAILLVNGGSNDGGTPGTDAQLAAGAAAAGAVVADLRMVPNQPLTFAGETTRRSEDAIIAYSWDKFLRGGNETWPLQLPMTKAAVRAMDAVTAFSRSAEGGGITIDRFLLFGGSKRGWTTWLAAAVDRRVVGIIPAVIDLLNTEPSLLHHWQSYGFWTPALDDYVAMGVMAWVGSAPMRTLLGLVDPYVYRQRFTMPKYLINAAGDQFFHPASSRFYFDDLPAPKYMWYVANASHALEERSLDVFGSAFAWAAAVMNGTPLPRFTWQFPDASRIVVTATDPPAEVRLWQATNPAARDFRLESIGPAWTSTRIAVPGSGVYEAAVSTPPRGWTAFFVELTYPGSALFPLRLSTPVRIVPDTLPHPPPMASVLAASYHPLLAPDSIASAFGTGLAERTEAASTLPLPVELGGISVRLTDKAGVRHNAPLFFASAGQVNYLVPAGATAGPGTLEVFRGVDRVAQGQVVVDAVAPGLFTANGSGAGVAAAIALTIRSDGSQESQRIFDENQPAGSRAAVPIALGSEGDRVYLLLFGTGMRRAAAASATIGGRPVDATRPLPAPGFVGLDQVNLGPLPRSLAGAGEVPITLVIDGIPSNVSTVRIR